jgi:hypothetical protein
MQRVRPPDIRPRDEEMTHLNLSRSSGKNSGGPHRGEFWMAESLPFEDGIHSKDRPVLIKSREADSFICYKCTSQESSFRERYRVLDLEEAGLTKYSCIDYELIRVPRDKLSYRLGLISESDREGFGKL